MTTATISLDRAFGLYRNVSDEECTVRIQAARAKLGKDAVLLVHHYQRPDVYRYADLTGDSLKLNQPGAAAGNITALLAHPSGDKVP